MPKVSVIIPVYGVEKYIERCARSLFEQTLDDIEYIFVDDCTPDKSIEILESIIEEYRLRFAEEKKVVRIVRMPTNSGLPAVRRHGIQLATGDYIIHCDSDDWVDVEMYRILYSYAKENNNDIVTCDYFRSDGNQHILVNDYSQRPLMEGPLWNKLVKHKLYTDNYIEYPKSNKGEDGALLAQLSYFSKKTGYIKTPLYYYFSNLNSICLNPSEEAILSRFYQECDNTDLRISFLKRINQYNNYKDEVIRWKIIARDNLLPLISDKRIFILWKGKYPEVNFSFCSCSSISLRKKISYFLLLLRLKRY